MIAVFLAGVLTGGGVVYTAQSGGSGGPGGGGPGGGGGGGGGQMQQGGGGGGGQQGGGQQSGGSGGQQGGGQNGGGGQQGGGQQGGGQGGGSQQGGGGQQGGGEGGSGQQGGSMAGGGSSESDEKTVTTGETQNAGVVEGGAKGAPRLLKHLKDAPGLWSAQAVNARTSGKAEQLALADEIEAHANNVPAASGRLPPLQEVTAYIVESQVLLAKMKAAGMDVETISYQIEQLTKPRAGSK